MHLLSCTHRADVVTVPRQVDARVMPSVRARTTGNEASNSHSSGAGRYSSPSRMHERETRRTTPGLSQHWGREKAPEKVPRRLQKGRAGREWTANDGSRKTSSRQHVPTTC